MDDTKTIDQPVEKKQPKHRHISPWKIIVYVLIVLAVLVGGGIIFHNMYYTQIFVDGQSMYPTLNVRGTTTQPPNRVDFGIVDTSKGKINKIKRFDIIATYYSEDFDDNGTPLNNAYYKIKRVLVLPNEMFHFNLQGELFINNVLVDQNFYSEDQKSVYLPKTSNLSSFQTNRVLGANEYWVLGDNRGHSMDSMETREPIQKSYILGPLVALEGTCIINQTKGTCENKQYGGFRFF